MSDENNNRTSAAVGVLTALVFSGQPEAMIPKGTRISGPGIEATFETRRRQVVGPHGSVRVSLVRPESIDRKTWRLMRREGRRGQPRGKRRTDFGARIFAAEVEAYRQQLDDDIFAKLDAPLPRRKVVDAKAVKK